MDYSEVLTLLSIEEKTREQPTLREIHKLVLSELKDINIGLVPAPKAEPKQAKPVKGMSKEDAEAHANRRV